MDTTEREARERFGSWLRSVRESSGMSLRDLGRRIGMSYQAVSYYENGDRFPDLSTLSAIAEVFGVPPWYPIYIALTPVAETLPPSDITVMDEDGELLYDWIVRLPSYERDIILTQVKALSSQIDQRRSQRGTSEAGPE